MSAFFEWMTESGAMENTLLVFMADHGHRFASRFWRQFELVSCWKMMKLLQNFAKRSKVCSRSACH